MLSVLVAVPLRNVSWLDTLTTKYYELLMIHVDK